MSDSQMFQITVLINSLVCFLRVLDTFLSEPAKTSLWNLATLQATCGQWATTVEASLAEDCGYKSCRSSEGHIIMDYSARGTNCNA